MAISETDTRNSYVGNSSITTIYPIDYKYFATTDVKVYADGVDITADVEFDGDGSDNTGGFHTPLTAYAGTVSVVAVLDQAMDQPTVLIEGGQLPAKVIEEQGFDRLNMQVRTNVRNIGNSLRAPDFEAGLDVLPVAADRANKVVGFDDDGQPLLALLDTLNSAAALDAAVVEAEASADAAALSETNAATSETNAGTSETNAANSAISAKGFITIPAEDYTAIPTAYPVDQASVMAVDTTGPGGTWPHAGMVFTHVFTDSGFDVTYEQIFVPASTTTGKFTQVRNGLTSGSTWSVFGEWNDSLSKTEGGTVSGGVVLSGTATKTSTYVENDSNSLMTAQDVDLRARNRYLEEIDLSEITILTTGSGSGSITTAYGLKELSASPVAAASSVYFIYGRNESIHTGSGSTKQDMLFGLKSPNTLVAGYEYRITKASIALPGGLLQSTDTGIQFIWGRNGSTYFVRILLSHSGILYDSGEVTALWSTGYDGHQICKIERDGSMSFWVGTPRGDMALIYRYTTNLHPWIDGVFSSAYRPIFTYAGDGNSGKIFDSFYTSTIST